MNTRLWSVKEREDEWIAQQEVRRRFLERGATKKLHYLIYKGNNADTPEKATAQYMRALLFLLMAQRGGREY